MDIEALEKAFEKRESEFDINNPNPRKVICVNNADHVWSGNDHASDFLVIGETYTVKKVDVHSWHTRVYLEEFPDRWFNSVSFEEIDKESKQ